MTYNNINTLVASLQGASLYTLVYRFIIPRATVSQITNSELPLEAGGVADQSKLMVDWVLGRLRHAARLAFPGFIKASSPSAPPSEYSDMAASHAGDVRIN
jgi:hypothetical protein